MNFSFWREGKGKANKTHLSSKHKNGKNQQDSHEHFEEEALSNGDIGGELDAEGDGVTW